MILSSIVLRVGMGEAFIRFYYDDDDRHRRDRIARTATATVVWTTTLGAIVALALAGPISRLLLGFEDPNLIDCAVLGLWAFTNLEMAYAQLRVDERTRTYVYASGANVALTVTFTIALVVFADQGARGLLLGNFGASAIVVLGLWWVLRRRFSLRVRRDDLREMLHFGAPTVPADASVYALQVVDRLYLFKSFSPRRRGSVRGRDQARDGRVPGRARLPVRVAAAGLLGRKRRGGGTPVLARHDLLRARNGHRRVRGCAARALDGAAAGGAAVLRRLSRAAVARARLGALRAVPRVRDDRRARACDLPHARRPRSPGSRSTSCCC